MKRYIRSDSTSYNPVWAVDVEDELAKNGEVVVDGDFPYYQIQKCNPDTYRVKEVVKWAVKPREYAIDIAEDLARKYGNILVGYRVVPIHVNGTYAISSIDEADWEFDEEEEYGTTWESWNFSD